VEQRSLEMSQTDIGSQLQNGKNSKMRTNVIGNSSDNEDSERRF